MCALFAALAVVAGMFGTLYRGSITLTNGGGSREFAAHSWGSDAEFGLQSPDPKMGYPLVFAVLMLFGAAVLSRPVRTVRAAGVVTAVGTAFLAGVVWSIGLQLSSQVGLMREIEIMAGGAVIEWDVGTGLGLLLVAVAFAVAATVLAFLPARRREPEDPYQADLTTPRHGFPIPEPGDAQHG